jgi:hypothetical protein
MAYMDCEDNTHGVPWEWGDLKGNVLNFPVVEVLLKVLLKNL